MLSTTPSPTLAGPSTCKLDIETHSGNAKDVGVGRRVGVDSHRLLALHEDDETGNASMVCLNSQDASSGAKVLLVADQWGSACMS